MEKNEIKQDDELKDTPVVNGGDPAMWELMRKDDEVVEECDRDATSRVLVNPPHSIWDVE
ncbi:MAG: hypothetical protein K2K92_01870 [Duncaniella sp.]|nr:hypothetical protein [Duncaniella sp.]